MFAKIGKSRQANWELQLRTKEMSELTTSAAAERLSTLKERLVECGQQHIVEIFPDLSVEHPIFAQVNKSSWHIVHLSYVILNMFVIA